MTAAKAGATLTAAGFKTGKITQVQSTAGPGGDGREPVSGRR